MCQFAKLKMDICTSASIIEIDTYLLLLNSQLSQNSVELLLFRQVNNAMFEIFHI